MNQARGARVSLTKKAIIGYATINSSLTPPHLIRIACFAPLFCFLFPFYFIILSSHISLIHNCALVTLNQSISKPHKDLTWILYWYVKFICWSETFSLQTNNPHISYLLHCKLVSGKYWNLHQYLYTYNTTWEPSCK